MAGRIELRRPGQHRSLLVTEGSADYWRRLGYQDVQPEPAPQGKAPKATSTRKRAAAKSKND